MATTDATSGKAVRGVRTYQNGATGGALAAPFLFVKNQY
jgi:hypothetical protein